MLDLGGTKTEPAETMQPPTRGGSRGQRVWAVLLVLDSFFVIVFGGALAAKLYQHWQTPAVRLLPARPATRPIPAKTESPAAAPRMAAAPATISIPKAKPAAKRASATARGKRVNGPAPHPGLLEEAPRHEGAQPQGAAAAAPASAPSGAKPKAQPVEFHYKGEGRRVELAGAFIVHGNGRKAMAERDGVWSLTVYLTPNTYRYWFVVDGKKVLDPASSGRSRGASVVKVASPGR